MPGGVVVDLRLPPFPAMRAPVGFIKRASVRLLRTARGVRLGQRLTRAAPGRRLGRRLLRAVQGRRLGQRLLRAVQARPLGRRLTRIVSERLGRTRVMGVLMGGGAAVALGVLSSLLGSTDQSRATVVRAASAQRPAFAMTSPTRFELTRDVAGAVPSRGGRAYYRRTTARHVRSSSEAGFLPLYREAARSFGVSWRLIASIHRQETAFSTVAGTYHGLNAFGCCAGPMQFNVKNGPVSTWDLYRDSFRLGERPRRYPHRTRHHPSVYDDFDAIMAAGALLQDSGATDLLDGGAWSAAYAYYGHDRFGVGYASQVVARAQGWELNGFCLNCPEDAALVSVLDEIYGVDARRELRAEALRRKHKKHKRHKARRDGEASTQAAEKPGGHERSPRPPASEREPDATAPGEDQEPAPTTPVPTTTTDAPPVTTTPAAPARKPCTPVARLLGCRP